MEEGQPLTAGPSTSMASESSDSAANTSWLRPAVVVLSATTAFAAGTAVFTGSRSLNQALPNMVFGVRDHQTGVGRAAGQDATDAMSVAEMSQVTLKASNEYTEKHGYAGEKYDWLDSGSLVEPHKQTTLMATLPATVTPSSVKMHWHAGSSLTSSGKLEGVVGTDGVSWLSETAFSVPGQYTVELEVTNSAGATSTLTRTVTCRYVRREIRSLSHDDRNRFFDAAKSLFNMETDPTIAVAANWTRGISYYVRKHLRNAIANKRTDRMHDGMGFLSQHMAITSDFEQALQAMDPQVSIPYWDFTIDAHKMNHSNWRQSSLWDSDLWTADWFGNATGASHIVEEGRWAYLEVPHDDDPNPEATNPYGLLRAPWNLNPSKYVTRFHQTCGLQNPSTWPTCANHHYALKHITDYANYVPYMAYMGHAGVHLMIGGSSNCHVWYDKFVESIGISNVEQLVFQSSFILRNAWRFGMCETPDYCSSDTPDGECKLLCRGCESEVFSEEEMKTYMSWWPFIANADTQWWRNASQNPAQIKEQMVRQVYCEGEQWIIGDQIEGNSPIDMPFWTIHPTMERLTTYKHMTNPFTNTSWYSPLEDFGWDGTCKWGGQFAPDQPAGSSMKNDYCSGHYEDDLSAFEVVAPSDALTGAELEEGPLELVSRQLSNRDIMNLALPEYTQYLPYVYDSFTWDHCEEDGFSFL